MYVCTGMHASTDAACKNDRVHVQSISVCSSLSNICSNTKFRNIICFGISYVRIKTIIILI